jgi:hypothetical protein
MFCTINNTNLLFIHIPRTSGTDIEKKICEKYYPKIIWPNNNSYINNVVLGHYKDKLNRFHSATHFTHNQIQLLNTELNLKIDIFFTIIRNPIDRAASLYHFWKFNSPYKFLDYLYAININNIHYNGILCDQLNPKNNLIHRYYHFLSQYAYLYPITNRINIIHIDQDHVINKILSINREFNIIKHKKNRLNTLSLFNKDILNHLYRIYEKDFEYFGYLPEFDLLTPP